MTAEGDLGAGAAASTMIGNDSSPECSLCALGPPPDMILRLPPPPLPSFLAHSPEYLAAAAGAPGAGSASRQPGHEHEGYAGTSPCRHSCDWRAEGIQYVEVPQQGSVFDDTWLIVLISACVGVVFVGIILATFMFRCKLDDPDVSQPNDDASQCSNRSNKNSTLSTSTASSSMQTTTTSSGPCSKLPVARLQHEAVLYPCGHQPAQDSLQDPRVMWATLTPRGTTRHYLEEHTYETIGAGAPRDPGGESVVGPVGPGPTGGLYGAHLPPRPDSPLVTSGTLGPSHRPPVYSDSPNEHVNPKAIPTIYLSFYSDTYTEPPAPSPILTRPKEEKAFDNTAFVDYDDPLSLKNEYYQLEDVLEPCDPIFSVQGLYSMQPRGGHGCVSVPGTLRPRVSSPTRIEHPNLPPLNLHRQHRRHHHHHHHHHQQQQQQHHQLQLQRKNSLGQQPQPHQQPQQQQSHPGDCTLLRAGGLHASSTYIPTI